MSRTRGCLLASLLALGAVSGAEDAGAVLEAVAKHLPPGVEPSGVYRGIVLDSAQADAIRIAAFERLAKDVEIRGGVGKGFVEVCCKVLEGDSSPKLDRSVIQTLSRQFLITSHSPLEAQRTVIRAASQADEQRKTAISLALAWSGPYESSVDASRETLVRNASGTNRPFDMGRLPTALPCSSLGVIPPTVVAASPACAPLTTVRHVRTVRLPEPASLAEAVPSPAANPFPGTDSRYREQFPSTDRLSSSPGGSSAIARIPRLAELPAPGVSAWAIPSEVPEEWCTVIGERARAVQEVLVPEPANRFLPVPGATSSGFDIQPCIASVSGTGLASTPLSTVRVPEGLLSALSCAGARDAIEGLQLPGAAGLPVLSSSVGAFDGSPSVPPAVSPGGLARATVSVTLVEASESTDTTTWCGTLGEEIRAVSAAVPPEPMEIPQFGGPSEPPVAIQTLSFGSVSPEPPPPTARRELSAVSPASLPAERLPRQWHDTLLALLPSLGPPTSREWQDSIHGASPPITLQPVPFDADEHWLGTYLPALEGIAHLELGGTGTSALVRFARPSEFPPASRILDCRLPAIPGEWAVAIQEQCLGINQGLPAEIDRAISPNSPEYPATELLEQEAGPVAELLTVQWPPFRRSLDQVGNTSLPLFEGPPEPLALAIARGHTPLAERESQTGRISVTPEPVALASLLEPIKKRLSVEQFAESDLMLSAGQTDAALALFTRIVKADPESGNAEVAIKKAFDLLSRSAKGRDLEPKFESWLSDLGNTIDAEHREYLLADALYRGGDFSRGIERARAFLERRPKSKRAPDAQMLIALCCVQEERRGEAIQQLKQLLSTFPECELAPWAQFLIGWLLMFDGKKQEAIAAYRTVTQKYADSEYAEKARGFLVLLGVEQPEPDRGLVVLEKIPSYACKKAAAEITVDGTPSEVAWDSAERINDFGYLAGAPQDEDAALKTEVRLLWDAKHLYVLFICVESEISAKLTKRDAEIWQEDCIGLFLSTGQALGAASKSGVYYKIQVSPLNTVHDAKIVHWSEKVTDDELKAAPLWNCPDLKTAARAIEPKRQERKVQIWLVEMAIPFVSLGAVPSAGDTWKMNVARIDKALPISRTLSWAPVERWFHEPNHFGNLKFVK